MATLAGQAAWAARYGRALNSRGSGFAKREAGLFQAMSPATEDDLRLGAGEELKRIHSLRSSTCLAINVFEPWRSAPQRLGQIFGGGVGHLSFEAKQHIWPPEDFPDREPPHLDILLTGRGRAIGIESKFVEPYSPADNTFKPSYFPTNEVGPPLWASLKNCQRLAELIRDGREAFTWLPAAQLLKHALGLSKNQPQGFKLVLLWYRIEGHIASALEAEIERFALATSTDLDFTAFTYSELISELVSGGVEPTPGYYEYLAGRYQLPTEPSTQLPLVTLASPPQVDHKTNLAETIASSDPFRICEAYHLTTARAPVRPNTRGAYLVGHDGRGGTAARSKEKVAAKAIFNRHEPLTIGTEQVDILDYEVPLKSAVTDSDVGDIDLLGIGTTSGRPWIIELKIGRSNTPLKALYQGLRYSAMLNANRGQVNSEVKALTGIGELDWPGGIAVVADDAYWQQWDSPKAGDWLFALRRLANELAGLLGIEIVFLDLGNVETQVVDGAAQLRSPLKIRAL